MSSSIGSTVRFHRRGSALAGFLIVLAVLLLGVAGLLFAVRDQVTASGGASVVLATIAGSGLVGVALLVGALLMRRGGWRQGELGIERVPDGQVWTYEQMRDVATFYRSGLPVGLAWRDEDGRRAAVTAQLARFRAFYERFGDDYVAARRSGLIAQLEAGGTCQFAMVPHARARAFVAFGPSSYAGAATRPVLLTARSLQAGDVQVPLDAVDAVDTTAWTERLVFRLVDGQQVRLDYTALLDLPLLLDLVGTVVAQHRAAR